MSYKISNSKKKFKQLHKQTGLVGDDRNSAKGGDDINTSRNLNTFSQNRSKSNSPKDKDLKVASDLNQDKEKTHELNHERQVASDLNQDRQKTHELNQERQVASDLNQDKQLDVDQDHYFEIEFALPEYVQTVARSLIKDKYECYLCGGALRDIILNIEPEDYDLASDALPKQILKIFPKAVSVGAKFGTVIVIVREKDGFPTFEVEVTTFRSEEKYVGGRWPTEVEFVGDIYEDLKRRDFTFNAMACDLSSAKLDGKEDKKVWRVYDPFGGRVDLKKGVVRAVGTPIERFEEDGLRIFRGCRMASQLEFEIEEKTKKAMQKALPVAAQVSMERIRDEFMKILKNSEKPSVGIDLLREIGALKIFLPEMLEGVGIEQKLFHSTDVYNHLLRTVDVAPKDIRLAALLHDVGKPRKQMPDGHFYGHDIEGERMVRNIMKRMKFSKAEIERTANLVRHHMFYYPTVDEDATEEEREEFESKKWSDAAVRRFIARVGEENIDDLFALRIADATANPDGAWDPRELEKLQEHISKVRKDDMALKITDLAIDGSDLKEIGVEPGPLMGEILQKLLNLVLEKPRLNNNETLTKVVQDMIE
jgi:poly(A) polymerase/tRNA nucleotidyltransferase (CCA-adding enzyme)